METSLLRTKWAIPPLASDAVPRPRLLARLQSGLDHRLILVSAPAGFGKTTLLNQWVHSQAETFKAAWLSLDPGENDPFRFWRYLLSALKAAVPELVEKTSGLFKYLSGPPGEGEMIAFLNEVAALPTDAVLVLDDYYCIQRSPVHNIITFLLEHMPPRCHLVIATREDPPLPLARLRGRGALL